MNKIWIVLVIVILSAHTVVSDSTPGDTPQVFLIIPQDAWDEQSLSLAIEELSSYGIPFILTGPEKPGTDMISGVPVEPLTESLLNSSPDAALLFIGGTDLSSLINNPFLSGEIQDRYRNGSLLAGIGTGTLVLGETGILNNIRVAQPTDKKSQQLLSESGAIMEESAGVITDSIITAQGSEEAKTWIDVIIRELIARQITNTYGVLYLGDTENGASRYVIPERLSERVISAVENEEIRDFWDGQSFNASDMNATRIIPVHIGDWVLTTSPDDNLCLLTDEFSGLSVPFGTVVTINTTQLGEKRDFSTNTIPIEDMIQDITFKDSYQDSQEYIESNKTLEKWTEDVNNTKRNVKEMAALLFNDIRIIDVSWEDLTLKVCIEGNGVGKGILDILKQRGDIASSLAYDEKDVSGSGCYEVLLDIDAPKGIEAYLTLLGKEGGVIRDEEVMIP